jgi:peptidoglycan pentaglycine glycine transferase (the first glycine)
MHIQEITNKGDWHPDTSEFLQSWDWGEFQCEVGRKILRLSVSEMYIQGFEHSLPFGVRYIYFPRADISDSRLEIIDFLKKRGNLFARVEPIPTIINHKSLVTKCRQPQHTLVLDLRNSEEYLLANMHSKTRYNIRLAEKKGVEIREMKNIDWFWELNKQTTLRDGFKSHGKEYYTKMLEMNNTYQLTAFFEDKPVASQIYISYGGTFTYLHGASSNEYRNIMAPYILQWKSIQFAKKNGDTSYDFWGVAAPKLGGKKFHTYSWDESDKLSNVTRYKAGFGGIVKSYPDAFEIPVKSMLYRLFRLAKKIF